MPAKVVLTVVKGPLAGTKYRFDEQMLCIVGRAESCMLCLSGDAGEGVSRRHCILDIRPPYAYVSDLSSRNGTFVNERKLDAGKSQKRSAFALNDGDHLRVGGNVFEISLFSALLCRICGAELPEDITLSRFATRRVLCPECITAGRTLKASPSAKTVEFKICAVCGQRIASATGDPRDAGGKAWEERAGVFICRDCQSKRSGKSDTFRMPELEARACGGMPFISDYRILRRIGQGGMGIVFLAESVDTLEKTALKIMQPKLAAQEQSREDFIREAGNLRELRHPNIVELKNCGYTGEALYLAMEYCSEGTLQEFMTRLGHTLEVPLAVDLTCQILDGLEYAHNVRLEKYSILDNSTYTVSGLVHRDIKPSNIFLAYREGILTPKIADFGLAKAFDLAGMSDCTRTGDFSGTLGFICKQQFLNYKYARPEVDVWAAAATLYYMLTGRKPRSFMEQSVTDISIEFKRQPVPIRNVNPGVPQKLAELIDEALDDRVQLRFKTASQLLFALKDAVN